MANADQPTGLKPIRSLGSSYYTGGGSVYLVSSTFATAIAKYDPVIVSGTSDADGIPTVVLATAGTTNRVTGSVIGRIQSPTGRDVLLQDDPVAVAASTGGYILVADEPFTTYEAQMDGAFAVTDVSSNANLTSGTASAIGISGWEISSTSLGAGATLQVKVLRAVQGEDNEVGANAKVEVMLNLAGNASDSVGV